MPDTLERERPSLYDPYCKRTPAEIDEYLEAALEAGMGADDYVWREEGTLNPQTGHFACTTCYIKLGMPSSRTGWKVPDPHEPPDLD